MKTLITSIFILILSVGAVAQEDASAPMNKPISFNKWKKLQVVEAQNKVVRLSNLLLLLKSEKYAPENILPQVAKESKQDIYIPEQQQQELVSQTEAQLKSAVASFEFAKELTLNDYFSVYLRQFKNNSEALETLAGDMDKSEIAEILKSMISINTSNINLNLEEKSPLEVASKQMPAPASTNPAEIH